jgi:hypothetical protein
MIEKVYRQQGFSVIELMIATLLGLFIIGGIIGIFIASTNNYRLQQALSEVQEKGRYALRRIRVDIQKAGYYINEEEDQIVIEWSAVGAPADYGANATNVLSIYRRGDGGTPNTIHRTSFFIDISNNSLMRNAIENVTAPDPGANQELIRGVARLNYVFGADLSSTSGTVSNEITSSIDWIPLVGGGSSAYLTAGELTALTEFAVDPQQAWNKVRSVQVELIVASDEENVVETPQIIELPNQFSAAAAPLGMQADQYFQAYTTTYALRNRVD